MTRICKRQNKSMPQMKSNRSKTTISHLLIVQCRCCCCCCLTAGCVRPSSSFPLMVEPPPTTPPAHGLMETNKIPTRFHFQSDKNWRLKLHFEKKHPPNCIDTYIEINQTHKGFISRTVSLSRAGKARKGRTCIVATESNDILASCWGRLLFG